jgi:hypothetical protein
MLVKQSNTSYHMDTVVYICVYNMYLTYPKHEIEEHE